MNNNIKSILKLNYNNLYEDFVSLYCPYTEYIFVPLTLYGSQREHNKGTMRHLNV